METRQHELGKSFTFWYSYNESKMNADYENALRKIGTFNTIEKFWQLYSFIKKPDDMAYNVEYHIFTGDVKPMWEDEANKMGSRWIFRCKKGAASEFWEELVLAYIGGTFEADTYINGIVVQTKKSEDVLAIWLRGPID